MTYYGRWVYKYEEAARRGALAALIVHDTDGAGYGWQTVNAPGGENYDLVRKDPNERVAAAGLDRRCRRDHDVPRRWPRSRTAAQAGAPR